MLRTLCVFACLLPMLALPGKCLAADTPLFSSDGYRITLYRSPTPTQAPAHARLVDTAQVRRLMARTNPPVLIDVYRRPWVQGRFIATEAHANLPGSHWLANTGDGVLEPRWARYFSDQLQRLSGADLDRGLLFYCRSDCWLSWNAVKRAAALGYTTLYWYRDGLDAWEAAGLTVQDATPIPLP